MQCVTPMFRYYQDLPPEQIQKLKNKGLKLGQHIISREEVQKKLKENENLISGLERINREQEDLGSVWKYQTIPCGHCWACKLNYSADWATRILCECEKSEHNYFITLTYNDTWLPQIPYIKTEKEKYENDGTWTGCLDETDVKKFLNSIRKKFEREGHTGIKYYYCGEYGTKTLRPHYHMILMNCPLDITKFYDFHIDKNYKAHWKSTEIEKYWADDADKIENYIKKNGLKKFQNTENPDREILIRGIVDIAEVEWSSAAYVARYCMKKLSDNVDKTLYYQIGKIPEFVRMSRRPGIGSDYYENNKFKIYENDELIKKTVKGNTGSIKPPKTWDRKFKEEFPDKWEMIHESRLKAKERSDKLKKTLTNYTDKQMLDIKKEAVKTKAKMLPRGDF